jgi:hypothetical protein
MVARRGVVKGKDRLMIEDVEQALLDPGSVFGSPEELLVAKGLSREQRIAVLRRWEYDASEVSVAVEEGMPGGNADLVHRILRALEQLGATVDVERVGPTKQHGIPD